MRTIAILLSLTLAAGAASAAPDVRVEYFSGVPQITLEGAYQLSRYTVYRASAESGPWTPISQVNVLCVGSCFVDDHTAVPGRTYWYRFDVRYGDGPATSYGPYPVSIAAPYPGALHAKVFPNPSSRAATIEVYLHGAPADAPLEARAILVDLQGRTVRSLFHGPLRRGLSTILWDGRDARGALVPAGQYFLRLTSPLGVTIRRVVRAR